MSVPVTDDAYAASAVRPAYPEPTIDQGDPFLFVVPPGVESAYRYYVVVTSDGFPIYGSQDLRAWQPLGPSLATRHDAWCWAPCVRYVADLDRPWVMLYSKAKGVGDPEGHQHHQIRRADAERPEGPYEDSGEVLTAGMDFAIDPDVYEKPDGSLVMAFATDYVDGPPLGTGLAEADISPDLRALTSEPRPVARAGGDWQVYEPQRSMPWKDIPGVDWARGDVVHWNCIEGPAVCTSPDGRQLVLYSGGNFAKFYGVGVLARTDEGWTDLSPDPGSCLLAPHPAAGVYGPGHCSVAVAEDGRHYISFHFRTSADAPRQFAVLPLSWGNDGLPFVDFDAAIAEASESSTGIS